MYKKFPIQARSQKILLGSAFEEKVDLLIVEYSPGAVAEFIIVWCTLIARACIDILQKVHLFTCPS